MNLTNAFQSASRNGVTAAMIFALNNITLCVAATPHAQMQSLQRSASSVIPAVEFSDFHLIAAAEKAGSFDFLSSSEEDIYNDLLN